MFYEKNASPTVETNNNNNNHNHNPHSNPFSGSINSSRRSSFHQPSSIPSSTKTFNGLMNRQTQQFISRPNLASPSTKQSTASMLAERMQRSKSYKDLFDPPSATASITHPVYYQQQQPQSSANPSSVPYSSAYHGTNPASTIVGSLLGSSSNNATGALTDYPRHPPPSAQNFVADDISSSSTGHLPKPPPGLPSQNARYNRQRTTLDASVFSFRRRRYKVDSVNNRQKGS